MALAHMLLVKELLVHTTVVMTNKKEKRLKSS